MHMNAVQRVKDICRRKKIPIYRLEKDLGFGNGYIGQLRKGTLPNDRLVQIANYLMVPVEYLMEGNVIGEEELAKVVAAAQKETPAANNGGGGLRVSTDYDKLNDVNKAIIDDLIAKLVKAQSEE